MAKTIVLYPSPGMGHLISMVELGKFILRHHPSFSITILKENSSTLNGDSAADYFRHISATIPSITFHQMPPISIDLQTLPSMESVIREVNDSYLPHVRRALETISRSTAVSAFIIDFFCTKALPIGAELRIPTYFFVTSGAHFTSLLFYVPILNRSYTKSFKDMNVLVHIPGVPPLPSSDMVRPLLDRTTADYQRGIYNCEVILNATGILVNTYEALQSTTLAAIRQGHCNPGGPTPPVYCVGPLLAGSNKIVDDCIDWLDNQPNKSVVYVCFGSLGLMSAAQLREIAEGLERSGCRFLWVVRSPPQEAEKWFVPPPEPDLDALLPEGFLKRTEGRGLVVKSWAPQVAVLNHAAVGGFVTHCGWNSVLEAVCAGVAMVAWPLYAEQHLNRAVLVEEMKVALRMEMAGDGFVAAEEVEKKVRELMDGESKKGKEIRKVVEEMSAEAKAAMAEGGTSVAELAKLVHIWKSSH